MRKANHRFVVETLQNRRPEGASKSIKRVWIRVGHFGKLATAERAMIHIATDEHASLVRLREVRA